MQFRDITSIVTVNRNERKSPVVMGYSNIYIYRERECQSLAFSDGLRIMVLPNVQAIGNIHKGIIAGKLKGQMPAVTPNGCRMLYVSISELTFSTISPI